MKKIKLEILQVGKVFASKAGSIIPLSSRVMEFNEDLAKELIKANIAVVYNEKTGSNSKKELELKQELQNVKEESEEKDKKIEEYEVKATEADKLIAQLQEENKKLEEELEKIKIELKTINEAAKISENKEDTMDSKNETK